MDVYIGAIFMFAGNFAPRGFALCQGQTMAISQNTALFSILGTTFGGNGTSTFQLPNLSGRGPVGTGTGAGLSPVNLGDIGGVPSVTLSVNNLPAHSHPVSCDNQQLDSPTPANCIPGSNGFGGTPLYSSAAPNAAMSPKMIGSTGGNIPVPTQDPYLGINFIIATQGIFPSRN